MIENRYYVTEIQRASGVFTDDKTGRSVAYGAARKIVIFDSKTAKIQQIIIPVDAYDDFLDALEAGLHLGVKKN